jgi:hypothetical protein
MTTTYMDTKELIKKHEKAIAVLGMIEDAKRRIGYWNNTLNMVHPFITEDYKAHLRNRIDSLKRGYLRLIKYYEGL